jgi:hypothetical protein
MFFMEQFSLLYRINHHGPKIGQKSLRKRETKMNTRGLSRQTLSKLLIACATFALLLSACVPASNPTSLPTVPPTAAPLPTQAPTPTAQPTASTSGDFTLSLSGVAQNQTVETVTAVPATTGGPWWEASPQYRLVTLQGYPVANHAMKPQIYIYPAASLASANEAMGKALADLKTLLQTRQTGDKIPFLPLFNSAQVMHAQMQYVDFKSGKGVRFLTQYSQGIYPINNVRLFYTFQGLTSDGKYYIAAILPVTNPDLPATSQVSGKQAEGLQDYPGYISKLVTLLDQKSADSFTPGLDKLDALIRSLEVK